MVSPKSARSVINLKQESLELTYHLHAPNHKNYFCLISGIKLLKCNLFPFTYINASSFLTFLFKLLNTLQMLYYCLVMILNEVK